MHTHTHTHTLRERERERERTLGEWGGGTVEGIKRCQQRIVFTVRTRKCHGEIEISINYASLS